MSDQGAVNELLAEGGALGADDAERLERHLVLSPDDFATRTRLLGYYIGRQKKLPTEPPSEDGILSARSMRDNLARHAVWFATSVPNSPLAGHPLFRFSTDESVYGELASAWRRQSASNPPDAMVLANAIAFFVSTNEILADELLTRAQKIFPDDPRWSQLRRAGWRKPFASTFQGSSDVGETVEKELWRAQPAFLENARDSETLHRVGELGGELAFALGQTEKARAYAEDMLAAGEGEYSDSVHNGHLLLGRIALRENDVERAGRHLILAGQSGATGMVPIFGPDMRLAADLLERGQRDVVLRYLALCRLFWKSGPLEDWIAQIRAGMQPDFGRHVRGVP